MSQPTKSEQTERQRSQTSSWAMVLSGPLSEHAGTLVLRDELGDSGLAAAVPPRKGWDRYEILGKLGEGGMGVVYLAQDEELGRKVAIKVLTIAESRDEDLQRFICEARITSQLSHPNIVPVHEFGTTPEGELYYAMRRVRGRELGQMIEEDEPSLVRRIQVLIDVCNAVEYAHARGVIHRDIKPENILIGDFGEVLVVDWGLALVLSRSRNHPAIDPVASRPRVGSLDEPDSARLTQWGEVIGTICYMSPEQARGDHHLVGPETDVYAIGAILYEMLAGRPPFIFERNATAREMLLQVVENAPEPPSKVESSVPPDLEAVVNKAMAPRMTSRYQSVAELRGDLQAYLEHRPVSAYRAGLFFRAGKLIDRHRGIFYTALVGLVLLLCSLAVFAALQYREKENTRLALHEAELQRDRVTESLRQKDAAVKAQQLAEQARIEERRQHERVERAEAHLSTGRFLMEHDPASRRGLDELHAAVRTAPGYYRAHYMLARALVLRGKLEQARAAVDTCLRIKPGFIPALWVRAEILESLVEKKGTEAAQKKELEQRLREDYEQIARAAPSSAPGHCALGRLALMDGNRRAALREFQQALKLDPAMPQAHAGLAMLYGQAKQVQKMRQHSNAALRRVLDQFTQQSLNRVLSRWSVEAARPQRDYQRALTLLRRRELAKARKAFDEAARGFRKEGQRGQELRCLYYVAYCQAELGQRAEAIRLLRKIVPQLAALKDDFVVTVRELLATLLLQDDPAQALPELALTVREFLEQGQIPMAATQSARMVFALLMLGRVGEARNKMDVALELTEKTGRDERPDMVRWAHALLLRYEGRPQQALALYEELSNLRLPRNPAAGLRYRLGVAACLIEQGQLEAAERLARSVADMARKRRLTSEEIRARIKLVLIRRRQGKLDDALSLASEIGTLGGSYDLQAGMLGFLAGNRRVAERFLKRALAGAQAHYARLYLILLDLRAGQSDPARRGQFLGAAARDPRWPAPLVRYLLGALDEVELRQAAQKYPVHQMEVAYYLAEKHLTQQMQIKALRLFESCKQARLIEHFEYQNSLDRLRQLGR